MVAPRDVVDAVVIGSGPNGLAAAITLARKGWDVAVIEREPTPGGAVRTEESTLPGFAHDTFSGFYGLLHASPAFAAFELGRRVRWASFDAVVSASLDPERAAIIYRDLDRTAAGLAAHDARDAAAWRDLGAWWERVGDPFFRLMLSPLGAIGPALRFARAIGIRQAFPTARMLVGPVDDFAKARLESEAARALLASGISHSDVSLESAGSTPMTLILAMLSQFHNMPVPVGGAGRITDALVEALTEAGGTLTVADAVTRVVVERGRAVAVETARGRGVRARHAVLADTGAVALTRDLVGEDHFPQRWLDGMRRFEYGTGIFKVDLALDGPVPWTVEDLRRTGVVHLTGTLDEMARANFEARHGMMPARPMLIIGQHTVADPTRAPEGSHTLWVETHVSPHPRADGAGEVGGIDGWHVGRDPFLERTLDLIEKHAPGFRDRIVGMKVHTPQELEARDPNLVGGDVNGGSGALHQQLVFRPVPGWFRYRTPVKGLYLCSASAHPGGGVHCMCGINAAKRVLRDSWRPGGILSTAFGARRRPA